MQFGGRYMYLMLVNINFLFKKSARFKSFILFKKK